MTPLYVSIASLGVSALIALLGRRNATWPAITATLGAIIAAVCGLIPALQTLIHNTSLDAALPWAIPGGAFHIGLDPLSSVFLIPILALSAICAIYGAQYLAKAPNAPQSWCFYNLLAASMVLVVVARNAMLFLIAWETMALTSFFLVMHDASQPRTRNAGWIYLVATHLGTAFLLALFAILGENAGSFEFNAWAAAAPSLSNAMLAAAFIFALIGFGVKAGFIPLHVWLPEAHPAAPSHVSALMSGVMIKTGIYGLLRTFEFLGAPAPWWGWTLIAIGLISGILGVLFALAQHGLKRLLAYHSVENIGIIAMGIGAGCLGTTYNIPALAVCGFAGALLHVINHALFKALLFLGAGAVIHATGTDNLERLGGLMKSMRATAILFLIGATAICGLPPLNGFVSEFLIYLGAFTSTANASTPAPIAAASLAIIAGLALIGGLAAACFAKAFGIVFLGEPRTPHAQNVHEAGWAMRFAMTLLAVACAAIGVLGPFIITLLGPAIAILTHSRPELPVAVHVQSAQTPLFWITGAALLLAALTAALTWLHQHALTAQGSRKSVTWDCGYAAPDPRMQYTASSFAQPLTDLFWPFLRTHRIRPVLSGILPGPAAFSTEPHDPFRSRIYGPLFTHFAAMLNPFRKAQHGRVQWYVLYVALTLLALFIFAIE